MGATAALPMTGAVAGTARGECPPASLGARRSLRINNVNTDMWLNEHLSSTLFREPSGDATDSYNRFGEDIAIAASLGFNMHRFGIEWARIEPPRNRRVN